MTIFGSLFWHFFELLKNKVLTWSGVDHQKVEDLVILYAVVKAEFMNFGVFAPLPCTVYLVNHIKFEPSSKSIANEMVPL